MNSQTRIAILACAIILNANANAYAEEQKWTIDVTGLETRVGWEDVIVTPGQTLRGYFTGFDANGDGALTTSEVAAVHFGPFGWQPGVGPMDFYYSEKGGLHLRGSVYRAGIIFGDYVSQSAPFAPYQASWHWTPTTMTTIQGPPLVAVPEPVSLALVAAGMAALVARRLLI